MLEYLLQIDRELFLIINGCNSEFADKLMIFISGKFSWIPFYIFLLYVMIKSVGRNMMYVIPAVLILITICDQGSVLLFKNIFQRLRPCHEESLKELVHTVDGNCGGDFGFISSHAANTMSLSVFLFLFLKKKFGTISFLIFLFPFIVSYSRVYLGTHYPGDVLCGMVLGGLIGYLFYLVTIWIIHLEKDKHNK